MVVCAPPGGVYTVDYESRNLGWVVAAGLAPVQVLVSTAKPES